MAATRIRLVVLAECHRVVRQQKGDGAVKKIFVAIGGACIIGLGIMPARAADMALKAPAVPTAYNWSGFYVGGNLGADWASVNSDPFGFSSFPTGPVAIPNVGFGGTTGAAAIGGGQLGFNWQFNRFVLGLEADIQDTSHSQTITSLGGFACGAIGCSLSQGLATAKADLEGSIRARVGVAFDRLLIYGTGGFATARVQVNSSPGGGLSHSLGRWPRSRQTIPPIARSSMDGPSERVSNTPSPTR
jgi:outer membrane immunogenic protein